MATNSWIDLGPPVTATGPRTCLTDPVDGPRRFYRVLGPDVVWIPPGTFVMGSPTNEVGWASWEGPQTAVMISRGYLTDYAWYGENSSNMTHVVGQKLASPWGLYDMHGNVWEWCQDCFAWSLPGGTVTDPKGPTTGWERVLRGGFWGGGLANLFRSAYRGYIEPAPGPGYIYFGFRVLLAPSQP